MKHIIAIIKPTLDIKGHKTQKAELDYLRLVYAVIEMRQEGENAQGYFVIISDGIPHQLSRWEHDYRAKPWVKSISALPGSDVNHPTGKRKTADLSGIVATAILEKTPRPSNAALLQAIQDGILEETILALEPHTHRIRDENKFPLGIRWDYYGVVDSQDNGRTATDVAGVALEK